MNAITICRFWQKIILLCAGLLLFSGAAFAQSATELDVGLVVSQFSAEIVTGQDFTVTEPDGNVTTVTKGKYFASIKEGKILLGDHVFPTDITLAIAEKEEKEEKRNGPQPRSVFTVNRHEYRGRLKIYLTDADTRLTVVNQVPVEFYVNAVLAPKSSPIWPDEAIKAQAVAVRSLAWYCKQYPQSALFAVRAVDPEAFYGGVRNENKNITKVAVRTVGQVLYHNGSPAATYHCESSGGRTVSADEALQKHIPYLQAVEDYDADCPSFNWEKKIQVMTISRILEQNGHQIGRLRGYRLSDSEKPDPNDRFASGRVKKIYWQGELGGIMMTGTEFANLLALNSTCFDVFATDPVPEKLDVPIENGYGIEVGRKQIPIEIKGREARAWKSAIPGYHFLNGSKNETLLFKGKGIGSGLGLSKWGAKGMADAAPENAENYYKTILAHYYPGTSLITVY